jgi:multiple sugar transport system substrate-binding protein
MLSPRPRNAAAARKVLESLAARPAQEAYVASNPTAIAAHAGAATGGYNALQKKAVELIASAKHVAQYLDRDTRPDFASTVVIPSLQEFIRNPKDIDGVTAKLEEQKKAIFAGS